MFWSKMQKIYVSKMNFFVFKIYQIIIRKFFIKIKKNENKFFEEIIF